MKVRRVIDESVLEKITTKRGNKALIPVNDGNGDLIFGPEVMTDPIWKDLIPIIESITEETEYVPFVGTIQDVQNKYEEFKQTGKLITSDLPTGLVAHGDFLIIMKTNTEGDESVKEEKPIIDGEVIEIPIKP